MGIYKGGLIAKPGSDPPPPSGGSWKPQLFCHSAQFSRGISVHLAHHLAAMDLRGDFAGSESRCDLLGQHAGN